MLNPVPNKAVNVSNRNQTEPGLFDTGYKCKYQTTFQCDYVKPDPATVRNLPGLSFIGCSRSGPRSQTVANVDSMVKENAYYLDRLLTASKRGVNDGDEIADWHSEVQFEDGENKRPILVTEKISHVSERAANPDLKPEKAQVEVVRVPFPEGINIGKDMENFMKVHNRGVESPQETMYPPHTKEIDQQGQHDGTGPADRDSQYKTRDPKAGPILKHSEAEKIPGLCSLHEYEHYHFKEYLENYGYTAGTSVAKKNAEPSGPPLPIGSREPMEKRTEFRSRAWAGFLPTGDQYRRGGIRMWNDWP